MGPALGCVQRAQMALWQRGEEMMVIQRRASTVFLDFDLQDERLAVELRG